MLKSKALIDDLLKRFENEFDEKVWLCILLMYPCC